MKNCLSLFLNFFYHKYKPTKRMLPFLMLQAQKRFQKDFLPKKVIR